MDELDGDGPLTDRGRHPLDGPVPDVSRREHARHARFEQQRLAPERPSGWRFTGLVERAVDAVLDREAQLVDGLTEAERAALAGLLERLLGEVAGRVSPGPPGPGPDPHGRASPGPPGPEPDPRGPGQVAT